MDNTGRGFTVGNGSTLRGCAARQNDGVGFRTTSGTSFESCVASGNGGDGFVGAGNGNSFRGCDASVNAGDGFEVAGLSLLTGCNAVDNLFAESAGAHLTGGANRVDGCMFSGNGVGVRITGEGNLVVRSSFTFNFERVVTVPHNNVAQMVVVPGTDFVNANPWANFAH
jgi:hypothetical protein